VTDCAAVSSPRTSSGSPWVLGSLAFAAVWWTFDLLLLRAGVPDRLDDTWEYGVVARALLEGHGFRTLVIHPPLWTLRDAANTVPVLIHGPLLPLLLAPILAIFGPHALDGIAWLAAAGAVATVPPLVRLGERCGHAALGAAAAIVWTLAPLTLHSVHHDVSLPIGAAFLVAALELLTRRAPRPFAAGVALGLGCLVRHEMLGVLPIAALAAGAPGGWWLLFGALLPLAPWWLHNALATGLPLFNLSSYLLIGYWGARPGIGVLREFPLTPARFGPTLAAWLPQGFAKWSAFAPHALKRALLAPTGALGWLAVLGAGFGIATRRTRRVALLATVIALIPLLVMSLTLYDERYLVPFLPLYTLGVARGLHDLAMRLPEWAQRPRTWIGLLVLALLPVTGPAVREEAVRATHARAVLATERAGIAAWSARLAAADRTAPAAGTPSVVFSDTPDLVAWTTGRPTVWLVPEEVSRLPVVATTERPARPDPLQTWFHVPAP
jgi:hypothetical protein